MLEQEIRSRENDAAKTKASLSSVNEQFESEVVRSTKTSGDLSDGLRKLTDQINAEVGFRIKDSDATSKHIQELLVTLEQEKSDRERSDINLRTQVLNNEQDLEKEKETRQDETSENRRGVQSLKCLLAQHFEDLKLSIEAEGNKRIATDERLEKRLNELRFVLDNNEQSRVQVEDELDRSVKALSALFDVEMKSREADMVDKSTLLACLEKRLESLELDQRQVSSDFQVKLKKLGDELQSETKERTAADDEITSITMIAKNLIEKESRERQKNEEEHGKRHHDLTTKVNQRHQATRDMHSAALETHANSAAKNTGELHRNLQALAERVTEMEAEIRKDHEMEKKKVAEAHADIDRGLTELKGALGAQVQNNTKNQVLLTRALMCL